MIDPLSTSIVLSLISTSISMLSFIIAYLAHREATKGPDIILIADEEIEVQVPEIEFRPKELYDTSFYEAYVAFNFVFLNRGSKGGAVIDIKPEIKNLSEGRIPRSTDRLEIYHNFKDGLGKIIVPKFFNPSIAGHESVSASLEFAIRLHVVSPESSKFKRIFRDVNDTLKVLFSYKKVCSNGKLLQESKEIKLLLRYDKKKKKTLGK